MIGVPFFTLQSEQTVFQRQLGIDLISIGSNAERFRNFTCNQTVILKKEIIF